ncbi:MAG: Ig-like domain-containing protein, partial [Oscillospiraceae bacterium]|nr:Ig-like domain-containing protein [Oscillospiraceae bacterium]
MRLKKLTAFVMALAIVLALVPAITVGAAFDIDDGLVLYYSFDNDSDQPYVITDDSGNGYTGAVLNTVHDGEGGPFGGEAVSNVLTIQGGLAHFPGGSSSGWRGQYNTGAAIKIPEDVRSDITGDYTVSMWVRVDNSYAYANQPQRFFDFGVSTTDSIFLRYTSSTGDMRFQDRGIGSGKDDSNSYISAYVNNEYLGNWHMLTVTYTAEDNTAAFYLDWYQCVSGSKFTRSLGDIPALTNDTYGMFLGRTQWYNENEKASNPDFCGWMDDVRIYNRALSEAEIDSLYSMSYHDEYLRSIVSGLNPSYTAFQGGPLYMPGNIEVGLDDGTRTYAEVIWDDITQEQLNTVGFFGVPGEVHIGDYNYGKIAYATITVISANSNLRDGLELYYSFENDGSQPSYITDDSYNGRAGQVLNNSDRWNRRQISVESAASGNVARFPGGTWMGNGAAIKIPEETRENITGDYTVSMWIKADSSYSFSGNLQRFFDFGVGQRDSIFVRYRVTDGDLRFQDRGLTSDGEDKRGYISTTDNSFADKWGLLTVTYNADDDAVVVYVNGNPVMSGDGFTRSLGDLSMLTNSTYGMYLGRTMWQDGENPDFCGWMDEVRIYSRAINEDEIQELYLTTCPEPMVQVAITHELEDGTVVEEPAPVTVAEGASYTYNAPIMIEYEGVIYRLSYVLSTLNIANVSRANNKIRAIYVIEEVTSQQEVLVEAYINTRPELPAFVNMSFNTGEIISVQTKWNDVPENGWDEPGEYIVNGMAIDYPVTATVTVYAIKSASVPEITYADMGARPSLPSAAAVTTTHGRTFNSAIEWDAMPEDKILSGESFDISGVLTDYPDVKVTTHVEFVTRSTKAVIAVADTYTTDGDRSTARYGSEDQLMISSTSGSGRAGYNRYAYLRFENPGVSEPIGARVKLFMNRIDNGAYTEYTIYAMNNSGWDEYELAWSWQNSYREGAEEIAKASYTPRGNPDYFGDWIEFDISDYINNYPDKEFYDFYISASTCAGYFSSREGDNPPVLEIDSMGKALTVRYMANGEEVRREAVAAPESGPFTFSPATAFVKDGRLYVSSGNVEIDDIADVYEVEVEVTETDFTVENPVINTYIDETPT